jgi:hypothetical protein
MKMEWQYENPKIFECFVLLGLAELQKAEVGSVARHAAGPQHQAQAYASHLWHNHRASQVSLG